MYDCNDAEFPPYRHAAYDWSAFGGGTDECTGFEYTSDSPAAVLAGERSELAAGDWELVGSTASTLSLRRRSNPSVTATLTVRRSDDPAYRTRIDLTIHGQSAA